MLEPALQAMRIYVARETEGENARNAREVLSVFGMLDNTQSRRAVYASSLAQRAVWLIRTGRYDRALRLKTLGNAVCPPQAYPIFRYIAMIENGTCGNFCPYGKEGECL